MTCQDHPVRVSVQTDRFANFGERYQGGKLACCCGFHTLASLAAHRLLEVFVPVYVLINSSLQLSILNPACHDTLPFLQNHLLAINWNYMTI